MSLAIAMHDIHIYSFVQPVMTCFFIQAMLCVHGIVTIVLVYMVLAIYRYPVVAIQVGQGPTSLSGTRMYDMREQVSAVAS